MPDSPRCHCPDERNGHPPPPEVAERAYRKGRLVYEVGRCPLCGKVAYVLGKKPKASPG